MLYCTILNYRLEKDLVGIYNTRYDVWSWIYARVQICDCVNYFDLVVDLNFTVGFSVNGS